MFMTQEDLEIKIKLFTDSFNPPLSNKEIMDFLNTVIPEEKRFWWPEWKKDLQKKLWKSDATKQYKTKKEIRQDIDIIEKMMDPWIARRDKSQVNTMDRTYAELTLEDLCDKRDQLEEKLKYVGIKFDNNNLLVAKQVPISNFIPFNNAGFAKCVWHSPDNNPSMHYIKESNRAYCFSCGSHGDIVDVIMILNKCTLPSALKIILQ